MSTWDLIGLRVIGRPRRSGYVRHNLWAEMSVYAVVFQCFYVSIMRGMDRVDMAATRGHRFKVLGGKGRGNVRGKFFTQRVVGEWNRLPSVVEANSIGSFKRLLDEYMGLNRIEGYR